MKHFLHYATQHGLDFNLAEEVQSFINLLPSYREHSTISGAIDNEWAASGNRINSGIAIMFNTVAEGQQEYNNVNLWDKMVSLADSYHFGNVPNIVLLPNTEGAGFIFEYTKRKQMTRGATIEQKVHIHQITAGAPDEGAFTMLFNSKVFAI